ncbi:trigger factor [Aurantibacillus circumpalustris]|uniref:trigger factor n=1 Tax=Aurantibacillus circumpalustris TaxID=3036359 RepID=UPI00295C355F|nr:trigger factor [Aurantibacillus circumpalustris]
MNITKHDIDTLNAEITISVTPTDYETRVSEGIKKVQRQANMPGFRPGKVPTGLIKKQYGTQILVDEINKLLNDTIYKYIEENKLEILGNPLPKDQTSVDFNKQTEFEFVYQLGLAPEFNVNLDNKNTFTYKTVKVDDALIEKYLKDIRRNYGKPTSPEVSGEKDVVFVDINELEGAGEIKAGGIFKSTSVSYERTKNEAAKAKLLGLKKEDKVVININDLYETAVDKSVSLGIDKELAETVSCNLQLTVKNISRMEDAELNQELFDKVYGEGKITNEEEFKNKIREELSLMFQADSEKFLRTEVENKLVEKTNLQLPDSFLKRWLAVANEKPITEEEIEKDYPNYSKSMQWRLIENKIIKDNSIQVTPDEAKEEAKNFIKSEYARYGQVPTEEDLEKISKDLLSKEKEAQRIFENLYSKKVLGLIKEKCTLDTKEVSYDEFFKN